MDWFLTAMKKYAVFSGRARRSEYWYFVLFYIIIMIGMSLLDSVFGTAPGFFTYAFYLLILLPSLSVTVRRLHDTDRSGWWVLITLIPVIGGIVMIVFTVQEGTRGDNRFGPDPKAVTV